MPFIHRLFITFTSLMCASQIALALVPVPKPPDLQATSWIILEANTNRILAEHNADEALPPASLTKMMTAYVASEKIKDGTIAYDDEVVISKKAWKMGGSQMFIEVAKRVSVIDLLRGIIIQSGNDSSVAIAEHIAGSEDSFADFMNQYAERMGLTNTHFMNASGLDEEGHHTSARDLAILGARTVLDHPKDYAIYAEKEFTFNNITQRNRNQLLWRDSDVDGIKTGFTDEAGYCLVGSAQKGNMRLVAVVMGTPSVRARLDETQALLTFGARFFTNHTVLKANEPAHALKVWYGKQDNSSIGVQSDMIINIAKGNAEFLNIETDLPDALEAPITVGQVVGSITVQLDGQVLATEPLVALTAVEEAGFFSRVWHSIKRFFMELFS